MSGACRMHGRDGKLTRYFGWNSFRKKPLGRHMHKWEGNIRMNLKEIGWKVVVWMHLAQDGNQ
jgi:hypothetical protein